MSTIAKKLAAAPAGSRASARPSARGISGVPSPGIAEAPWLVAAATWRGSVKGAGASAGAARKSHCANSGSRSARSSAPIPAAGARRVSEHAGLRSRAGRGGADGEEAEEGGAELSKFSAAAPSGGRCPADPSHPPFPSSRGHGQGWARGARCSGRASSRRNWSAEFPRNVPGRPRLTDVTRLSRKLRESFGNP